MARLPMAMRAQAPKRSREAFDGLTATSLATTPSQGKRQVPLPMFEPAEPQATARSRTSCNSAMRSSTCSDVKTPSGPCGLMSVNGDS